MQIKDNIIMYMLIIDPIFIPNKIKQKHETQVKPNILEMVK